MSKNLALPPIARSTGGLPLWPRGSLSVGLRRDLGATDSEKQPFSRARPQEGEDLPTATDQAVPVVIAFTVSSGQQLI
ncbi:MAG: hypothetical protein R3B96_05570 [Pirellulaceae bacterium]